MRTAALGASRGRLARVLMAESVLLSIAGGALGLVLRPDRHRLAPPHGAGAASARAKRHRHQPRWCCCSRWRSRWRAARSFSLMTVVKFGRSNPVGWLKEGGRSSSDSPARHRTRNVLVVLAQVALALMLMVVSGLMIRTFTALRDVQPGFTRPAGVQNVHESRSRRASSPTRVRRRAYTRASRSACGASAGRRFGRHLFVDHHGWRKQRRYHRHVEDFRTAERSAADSFGVSKADRS